MPQGVPAAFTVCTRRPPLTKRRFLRYAGFVLFRLRFAQPGHIATSTLWQLASQIIMACLSIVTVKLVAIGLTRELAGTYNSAYGYLQFFGILADGGLYAVAVRELSRARDERMMLGTIVLLRLIVTGIVFAAAVGIAWSIPNWRESPLSIAITIAAFVPVFTLLAGIQRSVFQVHYRMRSVFIAEVLQRVLTAGLIGITVALGVRQSADPRMAWWFLLVGSIGAFFLFSISSLLARRIIHIRVSWDTATMKRLLRLALPFGLSYLCMALYRNMDITLIALLRPDFDIQNAMYGFALRANEMAFLLPTFLLNSTLPMLSTRLEAGEDVRALLGKTFTTITLLGCTAGIIAMAWSRPLMHLLTSEQYLSTDNFFGADTALFLLGPSMILNGFVLFSFYTLLALGQSRRLTWSLMIGAALSQLINFALIPSFGFVGAAFTSIIIHLILTLLLLPPAFRAVHLPVRSVPLVRLSTFALLLAATLFILKPLLTTDLATGLWIIVLGGIAIILAELLGLRRYFATT